MNKLKIRQDKVELRPLKEIENGLDPSVLARQVLIKGENRRIFIDFVHKILEKTIANSIIEQEILKKFIFSGWKLRRMREIEKNLLNSQQVFDGFDLSALRLADGKDVKRRIRNLSKLKFSNELKEVIAEEEKLEKRMIKALKQLREEGEKLKV